MNSKTIKISLILTLVFSLFSLFHANGFSLKKIEGPLLEGAAPPPSVEITTLFEQPFFYLSKGRQCFVFLSADGKTVLKFLNYQRFRFPDWLSFLSQRFESYAQKRRYRFAKTMSSFQVADRFLREETGLLYLHLQAGKDLPIITVLDSSRRPQQVDLNRVAFLLQNKGTPFLEELKQRWTIQGEEGIKEIIDDFCRFLERRCQLLIADDDRDVEHNFGFAQHKLFYFDPGRLSFSEELKTVDGIKKELRIGTKRLRKILLKTCPPLTSYLDQRLDEIVTKYQSLS